VNIFGEPIVSHVSQPEPAQQQMTPESRRSLTKSIEKTIEPNVVKEEEMQTIDTQGLEEVYAAAEGLLRAGRDLRFVSSATSLPVEEVQMLARLMEEEGAAVQEQPKAPQVNKKAEDARLGALSKTIRRERHVL
jgi:serine/threonine protein kinase HipA of HipAB toxin-antitoxin module